MTEAHWAFSVRDHQGRTRRGRVVYSDRGGAAAGGAGGVAEFLIVLLDGPDSIDAAAANTAICIPKPPNLHALRNTDANKLPSRLQDLTFRPHRMAEYAGGRIVAPTPDAIDPTDIFPVHSEHPRLDRLALTLLEASDAEAIAPYTAVIRREFDLPAGADALAALETRLSPSDPSQGAPARAPGVVRLKAALRKLRKGTVPEVAIETMTEDLRLLRLFDDEHAAWPAAALDQLLGDVRAASPASGQARRTEIAAEVPPANIVPIRRGRSADQPPEQA